MTTTNEIHIDVIEEGKVIHQFRKSMEVDKDSFASMVKLSDYLNDILFELDMQFDTEHSKHSPILTLKVFSENDILFSDIDSYRDYTDTHRIVSRLKSDWSLITYVNEIPFYGDIEEGMIIK